MTDTLFTPSSWSAHSRCVRDPKSLAIHGASATYGQLRPQERLASENGESMIRLPVGEDINNIFADPPRA
ncbi:MAG: hypothetical protein HKL91_06805 [Candidatus Eremiobacteraeota bacterium]|nr:hypothetical protein [Candidatus Eremiobacteraeota bacterium]